MQCVPLLIVLVAVFIDSRLSYFYSTISLSDPDLERPRERESHLSLSSPRCEYWLNILSLVTLGMSYNLSGVQFTGIGISGISI